MRTLIVGASGLLGSAVAAAVEQRSELDAVRARITWSDPARARRELTGYLDTFGQDPWQVLWCAGVGVNGVSSDQFDAEVAQFELFLADLQERTTDATSLVFLASSAGGIYAGAESPPFREATPVAPLAPYGHAKLRMERALLDFHERTGVRVLIGRLSNLYGAGQNLDKQQGLISHLVLGAIERRPVSIFVPLDTIRDYLFVEDAAKLVLDSCDALRTSQRGAAVKILASQQGTTVATMIGLVNSSTGSRPPIVLGTSPLAGQQGRDIRLRSDVFPEVDNRSLTPLTVGIARTRASLLELYSRVGRRRT